jgi:hypothetical protein
MRRKPPTTVSDLPQRLRYLQPFRKKFASRRPEDLNEDTGMVPLMTLLTKRIQGLDLPAAQQLLEEDVAALTQWLSSPDQQNDPLQFAGGAFRILSPAELAKHLNGEAEKPPEPKLCLHIELPPDAKPRKVAGTGEEGILFSWKGLLSCLEVLPEQVVAKFAQRRDSVDQGADISTSTVYFGEVTGNKFTITGESWRGAYKQVDYALAVPGGHVYGSTHQSLA